MGFDIRHPDIQQLRKSALTDFAEPPANCLCCWFNDGIMVQNKVKHFLFCCGVEAQPFQNDFRNVITIVSVPVKMAAILILCVAARFPDVV